MTQEAGQTMYPKLMRDIKHTAKKVPLSLSRSLALSLSLSVFSRALFHGQEGALPVSWIAG